MNDDQHEMVPPAWDEGASQTFVDQGRYFVPEREEQIAIIAALVPPTDEPFHIYELACGEGLLADALLERFPSVTVHGLDGSSLMLQRAQARLLRFGERFVPMPFRLEADEWRRPTLSLGAVVSSLAIHHLDGPGKQALFRDVFRMLAPDGVLVIADLVEPARAEGNAVAAEGWDEAVRARALHLDGSLAAFERFQQLGWNLYRHPDPMDQPSRLFDQLRWMEAAGFRDVDVHWMKAGHAIWSGRK